MPDLWKEYQNMGQAIDDIPSGERPEEPYSIPDVYGKAIQLCLSLHEAYENQRYDGDAVQTWRGLVTLLALQNYLELPLAWEKVSMPDGKNPFSDALRRPPKGFSVFSDPARAWDGTTFYVLKWAPEDGEERDLLLYSPATLVYPVADWREAFGKIPEIKWFDRKQGCFSLPEPALEEPERKLVSHWLRRMEDSLNAAPAAGQDRLRDSLLHHIRQYGIDLGVSLRDGERQSLKDEPITKNGDFRVLGQLNSSVKVVLQFGTEDIPATELFSEQICYFDGFAQPFQNCACSGSYPVTGRRDCYALLPIRAQVQKLFKEYSLADGITMEWGEQAGEAHIRVTVPMPSNVTQGMELIRIYQVQRRASPRKNAAVPYFSDDGSLPLIAVWPGTIRGAYQQYYVMLEDSGSGSTLKVAPENTSAASNPYVTQTHYVPYAIPLTREYPGSKPVSVGVITPRAEQAPPTGTVSLSAEVAVDFGTSSTRVFARLAGADEKREIQITRDAPLVLTAFNEGQRSLMRDYFAAPHGADAGAAGLFSIYRRSCPELKADAQPVLDGVIYQSEADERLEGVDRFMPDLKWSNYNNRTYYEAFIKQLCHHVMTLLHERWRVNTITWKYALPESMAPDDRGRIEEIWTQNLQDYLNGAAQIQNHAAGSCMMESEAASRYFLFDAGGQVNAEKGYLVVDIGGGSSDLALWQGDAARKEMKWHASVNVAGRKLFTRWVAKFMDQLTGVIPDDNEHVKTMLEFAKSPRTAESVRNVLVERILNAHYKRLLDFYQANTEEWSGRLRTKINLSVSLLLFALGCQMGLLLRDGTLAVTELPGSFTIAVGGNGSKMLDWIGDTGDFRGMKALFRAGVQAAGARMDCGVELQPSRNPKEEVARGLLEDQTKFDRPDEAEAGARGSRGVEFYLDAAKQYVTAYNREFPNNPIPGSERLREHLGNELSRYQGDLGALIHVFMEAVYECLCAETGGEN